MVLKPLRFYDETNDLVNAIFLTIIGFLFLSFYVTFDLGGRGVFVLIVLDFDIFADRDRRNERLFSLSSSIVEVLPPARTTRFFFSAVTIYSGITAFFFFLTSPV